ncbi:3-oxoadipate enol-lactonase [Roseinatronobacter alkalisoli]|uniref:3-oxoadipate enol-lactonase n=1 Tax=Roseinatronobacter alkalisoli TaxID=3028235 RepID=A0ABT5T3F2_9RHOB|nr:3-oxoadipate enol-lactonase [Roseinatronobacter sp. HJB301]MDD7969564.1 3-oxoadipate enol-lactonase [Roseinatronobacter sp. HJB301]
MKTVIHNGTVLHIRDEGPRDGAPVLFANSLGTDLRVWDAVLPLLPDGLRLIRYDKRGHGLSDAPPAPYAMDDLIADAAAVLDALQVTKAVVVGLSIGGMIAQGLAHARPDLVRGIVLMDTAARIGPAQMWQDRIKAVQEHGIAPLADGVMARWFAPAFHRDNAAELALWRNMLCRTTRDGYAGCCAAIAGADLTDTTRALDLPAIAMAGSEDGATPPELVRATASLLGAQFHLIDGAGHLPCVESPARVADLITAFLKETA